MTARDDMRASACTGKKTYTLARARSVARDVSRRHDEPMQPYHCTFCHGWHVGQPGGKRRRQQQEKIGA